MPKLQAYEAKPDSPVVPTSVSIPKELAVTIDKLLTPAGLTEVPKGAWSQLISNLLAKYIEETAGIDSLALKKRLYGKEPRELLAMPYEKFLNLIKP